jgi:hypothetical protein
LEIFKIYTDRLKDGESEALCEEISSDFLEIQENDLIFEKSIEFKGKAYVVDNNLVIQLCLKAKASIPCKVCNRMLMTDIIVDNLYHLEPIKRIKSGVFDFSNVVRESLLLETPSFNECQPSCRDKEGITKYLKKEELVSGNAYSPFENL